MTVGCRSGVKPLDKSSPAYRDAVSAFYVGLAALDVGDDVRAESKLSQLTQIAPDEPAGWANWGVLALRQRNFEAAAARLEKARALAPDNDEIHYLIGLLESSRGKSAESISALRRAIELDPQHLRAIYALAGEIERQGDTNSEAEYQLLIQKILAVAPDNLAASLDLARIAAKRGDVGTLRSTVNQIAARSTAWPPEVMQHLNAVQTAAAGPEPGATAARIIFLRNVLVRVPEYRRSLAAIKPPPGEEAIPFTGFLKLESPSFSPAAADTALTFNSRPVAGLKPGRWDWVGAVMLGTEGTPTVAVANGHEVHLATGATFPFPGGSSAKAPLSNGVLPIDFDYDFKTDLVLAGSGGL
ncbi:MAG TPA: tetratricopeptide repeat protein, partial [Pyrinomonadaceae bacterium]|nr:tetratricopeptide repeat protein [Pyrinomonadaceae bacterium]